MSETRDMMADLARLRNAPVTYQATADGYTIARITSGPMTVEGIASDAELAYQAALFAAEQSVARAHPDYRPRRPYPDHFVDDQGVVWERVEGADLKYGTYRFRPPETDADDLADEQTMFLWGVRVQES
jgi:hypothetical protein